MNVEARRLAEDRNRTHLWKRWGPYLSERQWGTVREDYSFNGDSWSSFPHEQARSRAYRWGEDGLLGFCDRQCRLCFGLGLWNKRDPILKERLFGLSGPEGNHGEDVKECYFYLDSTPTHSYAKALYKYPQTEFPYERLVSENRASGVGGPEIELEDTGVFDDSRYFDVGIEYAKAAPEDLCIQVTVDNRGPEAATLHLLPTLWFRNTWSWGGVDAQLRPQLELLGTGRVSARHETLGDFLFAWDGDVEPMFTENETNSELLWGVANAAPYVKDAFHHAVVNGNRDVLNPQCRGTKFAPHFILPIPAGERRIVRLRLVLANIAPPDFFGRDFDAVLRSRRHDADEFHSSLNSPSIRPEVAAVSRQARAGLLWSKQFYHYTIREWLSGDSDSTPPPDTRQRGRNATWPHFHASDLLSVPDKWEYPWFASWDLAFHMIPMAELDPDFAKHQLSLLLREWYMHPNGQLPAYEFGFHDVNPPVHAWAAWRVYKMTGCRGERDRPFLEGIFQKLLLNFTWWVNRKDPDGNNLFQGGFLGLDNIGVFDRSQPLPIEGELLQSDGTAWMAFYSLTMLSMALELAQVNPVYEDLASKFFEHYVSIAEAMNGLGGTGLWDETDGFYYDKLKVGNEYVSLTTRSLVGLLPIIAVEVLDEAKIQKLAGFVKRMQWFMDHNPQLAQHTTFCKIGSQHQHRLLSLPTRERLERILKRLLDEDEFLSPHGIRSLSRVHHDQPFIFRSSAAEYRVNYVPGEGDSYLFGGNSNWRGPLWFPINYLIIEALERYSHFYGADLQVEYPARSGVFLTLDQIAAELSRRQAALFLPDEFGHRPCHGSDRRYAEDPHWKELLLFHEYFHGETGRGCGASHQTGWTALVVRYLSDANRRGNGS